jgi:hypothetical protein
VRVPVEAGEGKATVTFWFPDWQDGKVKPVRLELPVAPR